MTDGRIPGRSAEYFLHSNCTLHSNCALHCTAICGRAARRRVLGACGSWSSTAPMRGWSAWKMAGLATREDGTRAPTHPMKTPRRVARITAHDRAK